jgi:hypothetical protein
VLEGFDPASLGTPYSWAVYSMTLRCNITQLSPLAAAAEWHLPQTRVSVPYALMDQTGAAVTDTAAPPLESFTLAYAAAAPLAAATLEFELRSGVVPLVEKGGAAPPATLSELVAASAGLALAGAASSFAYSEALMFRVQLAQPASQAVWGLRPLFLLLTATKGADSSAEAKDLTDTWCGLNGGDALAAMALRGSLNSSSWPPDLKVPAGLASALDASLEMQRNHDNSLLQKDLCAACAGATGGALMVADPQVREGGGGASPPPAPNGGLR